MKAAFVQGFIPAFRTIWKVPARWTGSDEFDFSPLCIYVVESCRLAVFSELIAALTFFFLLKMSNLLTKS